jgi:hypothetical protein
VKLLATAKLCEFDEYKDVILRIHTDRGSMPIVIVSGGIVQSAERIGEQILESFDYHVESVLIPQKEVT